MRREAKKKIDSFPFLLSSLPLLNFIWARKKKEGELRMEEPPPFPLFFLLSSMGSPSKYRSGK